jgi:hypothetical protein
MSAQAILVQDDFGCLGLTPGQGPENNLLDAYQVFATIKFGSDEIYRPENLIPDEAHKFIRNWELAYLKQKNVSEPADPMATESFYGFKSSGKILDLHFIPEFAPPPKRFYRTFWKSLTSQVVRSEKKRIYDRSMMSSSEDFDQLQQI